MKKLMLLTVLICAALPTGAAPQTQLTVYELNYLRATVPAQEKFTKELDELLADARTRIKKLEARVAELEAKQK